MAYSDPQATNNPTAGQPLPAAWGDVVRDDLEWLARNKPHCRAYNSANISISNNTATIVTLDSERVDVGGCHSTSSNTSRFTVPSGGDGFYLIGCDVEWGANNTGTRTVTIRLNGTTAICREVVDATASTNHEQSITTCYQLVAGDYVETVVQQTSGGALNVVAQGNASPEMWWVWQCI